MEGIGKDAMDQLFGEDDPTLALVMQKMRRGRLFLDESKSRMAFRQAILHHILDSKRIDTVSKVFVAMVAVNPKQAHFWLETIRPLFVEGGTGTLARIASPAFAFGLALGTFRAGVWVDLNCEDDDKIPFREKLPGFIADLIMCRTELVLRDAIMEGREHKGLRPSEAEYDQPLSQEIKSWLGKGRTCGGRPKDVAEIVLILQNWLDGGQHWDILYKGGLANFGMQIWQELLGSEFHRRLVVDSNEMLTPWARQLLEPTEEETAEVAT